jgi:hypothetical protein
MTGLSVAALALAAAFVVQPGPVAATARLAALSPPSPTRRGLRLPLMWAAALLIVLCTGPVGLVCAGLVLGGRWLVGRLPAGQRLTALVHDWRSKPSGFRGRANAPDPLRLASCWDLLAACLRGGLPVPVAVQAVASSLPARAADALRHAAELLALGADPVAAWAPALAEPLTAELARGARRSARSGAALAAVAEGLATRVRAGADEEAEARAQRAAVAVTGPLGLCFLPAFLCVGVVPVVIGLATRLMASW